ncbi:response regulator transcription factor [Leadbettera azotonutricia]|uniref:Phosphate regulon transcriptional regulatory protein PhoB n=1 Tax=Leadbettera azotonutricia (strain ATCC BAA-888 / DSM 13862 / ZAS-9) TaxID=545695 RepID=F5Y805_LEAAZ|nr:response regulator transcription factor [Leadbettera azotonutricia]AEF80546.1 alkaline phosphatase synthesis transcriptional regulatory protein PhoP [Leadbettera azotonutricia ZAS-9]
MSETAQLVYIVEDDQGIRDLTLYTLNNSGFKAKGFPNGKEFWKALEAEKPGLVLLDIMLPGEDGLAILKRLRNNTVTVKLPVMMLTAKGSEYDKVLGLDSGADDYLAKPFGMMELIARVKALLRRVGTENSGDEEFVLDGLKINIPRHTVTVNNEEIILTIKEFDLLVHLLKNKDMVLSRDQLLQEVWGYEYAGETRTVDAHILTLRTKLKASGDLIQTVRGLGYKIGKKE